MNCGGVLVPTEEGARRTCFVRERELDATPQQLQLEVDHIVPRAYGGADGPTHKVHAYCQRVQGAMIANSRGAAESGYAAGLAQNTDRMLAARQRNAAVIGQQAAAIPGRMSELARLGNHNRYHVARGITKPACELCTVSP